MKKIFLGTFLLLFQNFSFSQSIVNTEKLFTTNDWLNFNVDIEYRYDNDPPSILIDKDLNINLGFVLNF